MRRSGPVRGTLAKRPRRRRLGLVLWNGHIGGAEVFTVALAERMQRCGADVSIVFIEDPYPLASRIPIVRYQSLGFERGRDVLWHPRRYASEIARVSQDGVLLVDCGFMGGALRAGGYGGPIVAVEHGALLGVRGRSRSGSSLRRLSRISGAWADDIEVAVSDFVLADMVQRPHTHRTRRIYNGVDPSRYRSKLPRLRADLRGGICVIAFAGRLVHGKGADYLLRAVAHLRQTHLVRLLIAGEGPERGSLEALSCSLGIDSIVQFLGRVDDMPRFWRASDIVVVPSAEFVESCPMTVLEAMATGRPVIATRNGGLPELVAENETGLLVSVGDDEALADALTAYIEDRSLRISHGRMGEALVEEKFHIDMSVRAYLGLFDELAVA